MNDKQEENIQIDVALIKGKGLCRNYGGEFIPVKDVPVYVIRPLEWTEACDAEHEGVKAIVFSEKPMRFMYYVVRRWIGPDQWHWCQISIADSMKTNTYIPCDSLEDGKEKAWQDWLSRIAPTLIKVNSPVFIEVEAD